MQHGPVDRAVAALAAARHGIVTRRQLLDLGLGRRAIDHRIASARLHVMHRGVYAVGHRAVTREGSWIAAVLAVGDDAVLSHRSAAALWGLRVGERRRIEVSVPRARRSLPGIWVHRSALAPDEVTVENAIPTTGPQRTLLDLAVVLDRPRLERAIERAEALRLADHTALAAVVARHRHRAGAPKLRAILEQGSPGVIATRSELEDRFLAFLDAQGLPRPRVNAHLNVDGRWYEVDCLWPAQRVIVELDGHATHATAAAFERDRARDRVLQAAGWTVVRITWRQLHGDARFIARDLARLLAVPPRATDPPRPTP